jgi:hypothetical protein
VTAADVRPRGKLAEASPALRRLWALLYRAVRRDAQRVDELTARLRELEARVAALEDRS